MPLSAAIKAREKVWNMVPMLLLQITVNLMLDWLLIVHYKLGVWGGIGAVLGTFVLTIPVRLIVVRQILGGIYFPTRFFIRVFATLMIEGAVFHWITSKMRLLERFDGQWQNVGLLILLGALYAGVFLILVRLNRVVRQEDIEDFHALGIERLNKVLRFMVR
jgi:hypothetical protein